jgi:sigma-B regulation protein RsbU (phosphoserine phosphatase)
MRDAPPAIELAPERAAQLQASLRVPLVAEESLVGLLIVSSLSKTRFAPGSVALLKTFGSQAAVSIQRVRLIETLHATIEQLQAAQSALIEKERIERELELARELQLGSLPSEFPEAPGVHFASAYRPAREVGGDLYDVIELGNGRLGLFIADVSDKGLPAAFYMGLTRSLFLAEARRSDSPREVLNSVNRLLGEINRAGMFVTAFYGVYDVPTGRLRYSRAGHDQPLWLRPDGSVTLLDARGMLLGSLAPGEFELTEAEAELSAGDMLILYTDGMTDALDPYGVEYGARHWIDRVRECASLPADHVCHALFDEVAAFQLGAPQFDDMALLVMQITDS